MLQQRYESIVEELVEASSMEELKGIWCFGQAEGNEYGDADCVPHFKTAVARLKNEAKAWTMTEEDEKVEEKIQELLRQLESTKSLAAQPKPVERIVSRSSKKYRLLKLDVAWSTKPQVHAVMQILGANAKPGDVLDNDHIVQMMVENEHVLQTRQGGKRIWDYYKGDHENGLVAHGNLEIVQGGSDV